MMVSKRLLDAARRRRVPQQFSWIDQRLVRDGHIRRCSHGALALYLLLVTVCDAEGLSYYGERGLCERLNMSAEALWAARAELVTADLIAFEHPLYQVLGLDTPLRAITPPTRGEASHAHRGSGAHNVRLTSPTGGAR